MNDKKEVDIQKEIHDFIVATLQNPKTKENPEMVIAITRLIEVFLGNL
ncbi:hypothetical protein [Lactococcus lactis]|nr:hypothetical protein [Lactococcus lactis]